MRLIRYKDAPTDNREDGRSVTTLISHAFKKPIGSFAFYLCKVPGGKFGAHHHSEAEEIIMFPIGGKITVNEEEYIMDKWDFVVLEPGDVHGSSSDSEDTIHLALKFPDVDDKVSQ